MTNNNSDSIRPRLTKSRDEVRQLIAKQIDKAQNSVPDASVNENDEACRWYEYTAELLRQICTTDELTDEFTGRDSISFGEVDISTGSFLKKLISINDRLELYPEPPSKSSNDEKVKAKEIIERLISRFHIVVKQMRQRHNSRPTLDVSDEYDVQDLFHALLKIYFDDVRSEEWTPSYAGRSSRMDFLIKSEKIVIEVKKTREKLSDKEVGDQLSIDIVKYRSHPDCNTLICFIYDPEERILNPRGLEDDLSQQVGELKVKVYVVPK